MKKVVWKYRTGQELPAGALYLHTMACPDKHDNNVEKIYHYFLVDGEEVDGE